MLDQMTSEPWANVPMGLSLSTFGLILITRGFVFPTKGLSGRPENPHK